MAYKPKILISIEGGTGSSNTATSGKVLIGDGTNFISSTPTFPNTATSTGTILRADGTNWVATTTTYPNTNAVSTLLYASSANVMSALTTGNNGVLVTSNTGVPSILAGGSTGQVLQANSAAAPSFSTATYPATATGTGTILRADGTNWVATTATYPITAGTALNVLQSDGTNFVSTAPIMYTTNFTITNAQLKAATNVTVVAAQGAGKVIVVNNFILKMNYGGTNVFTNNQNVYFQYGSVTTSFSIYNLGPGVGFWQAASSQYYFGAAQQNNQSGTTTFENALVSVGLGGAITGNAANNNTVTGSINWYITSV